MARNYLHGEKFSTYIYLTERNPNFNYQEPFPFS
jgi:hypothetical protein